MSAGEFVQGTAYVDVNNDGQLDTGDSYLAGATVKLFAADGTTLLATTTTDTNGAYMFNGLQDGATYQIVEVPPAGSVNSSAQAPVQLDTASVLAPNKIQVTLAPANQTISLSSLGAGIVDHVFINGAPNVEWLGQLNLSAGQTAGGGTTQFATFCTDLFHEIGGTPLSATIQPTSSSVLGPAAGEIAYLFNHYDNAPLTTVQAEGLQLAIWKLEYDGTSDFTTGQITMPMSAPPGGSGILYDSNAVPSAMTFLNEAAGKSETALYLNALLAPPGGQSQLAMRSFNFGNQVTPSSPPLDHGETATIGFWNNKNGQALINSFNGGPTSTALASWLASTFPNLYGATAGANDLVGSTNAGVAALFKNLFSVKGQKVYAQVLANALAVYATTPSLGGAAAVQYGFNVSATGTGSVTFNIGANGDAFGVPDGTPLTVMQILTILNAKAKNGILFFGDPNQQNLINEANTVADGINQSGDIS